jgi:hypothetical protein
MSVKKISQLNPLTSNEVTSSIDLLAIVDTTNTETKKITVDNLLSGGNYSVSGSFSGSFQGDGSGITGVTGEWDGSHNGNASITGSLTVTSDVSASGQVYGNRLIASAYVLTPQINGNGSDIIISNGINITGNITASGNISSSADVYGITGSFLHLLGDGSQLTGVESEWDGTLNGNGEITGSLVVTGDVTGSNISASNTVYGITGSFSHLQGNSPFTVGDQVNFQQPITSSNTLNIGGELNQTGVVTTSGTNTPTITGKSLWKVATTGVADSTTLPNGVSGQRLSIYCYLIATPAAGTVQITPTTSPGNYSSFTLDDTGESVDLIYDTTIGWVILGSSPNVIIT